MPSMYAVSVGTFTKLLTNLAAILDKTEAYATERKFKVDTLVNQRLAWDMLPLSFQIQNATDHAKGAAARLGGRELPSWPDDEKTFAELQARVKKALDYLATFTPADIDGSEDKPVKVKVRGEEVTMRGEDFFFNRAQPNFWFHTTTAYAILRHNGVPIGKRDFTG
ncbi:MAG: DUF1993 domain-containing protein [Devosia sp.]|nr:DUF1993 domain-containing protein [Devosia sp.]